MGVDTATGTTHELDAREIDGEPFSEIMTALAALPDDGTLLLVNSFEPEPLYDVLTRRGFAYDTTKRAEDEWCVSITRV